MNFMKFGFTDQQYNFKCHFFDLLLISGKISRPKFPPTSVLLFAQKKIVPLYKNEQGFLKILECQQTRVGAMGVAGVAAATPIISKNLKI